MTFSHLIAPLPHSSDPIPVDPEITFVTPDPALCRPGALYVAIAGFHRDGHSAIPEAVSGGAAACLIRSDRPDQAMLVSLAGLVATMMLLVREISSLFELVKTLFGFG